MVALDQRSVQFGGQGSAFFRICNAHTDITAVGQPGRGRVQGFDMGGGLGAKAQKVRGQWACRALGAVADGRGQGQGARF